LDFESYFGYGSWGTVDHLNPMRQTMDQTMNLMTDWETLIKTMNRLSRTMTETPPVAPRTVSKNRLTGRAIQTIQMTPTMAELLTDPTVKDHQVHLRPGERVTRPWETKQKTPLKIQPTTLPRPTITPERLAEISRSVSRVGARMRIVMTPQILEATRQMEQLMREMLIQRSEMMIQAMLQLSPEAEVTAAVRRLAKMTNDPVKRKLLQAALRAGPVKAKDLRAILGILKNPVTNALATWMTEEKTTSTQETST